MRRTISPALRRAARLGTVASLALALGCGTIDRLTGVSEARELRASGVAAEAEVLSLWDTGITVNEDPVIGLRVEVRPAGRPPYPATIEKSLVSRLDVPWYQPGRVIPLRFDPRNPARVAVDVYGPPPGTRPRDEAPRSAATVEEIRDWMEASRGLGRPSYLEAHFSGLRRVFVTWNIPISGLNITYYSIYCRRSGTWTLLESSWFQPAEDQTHYVVIDPFELEVRFVGPRGAVGKTVSLATCVKKPSDPDFDPAHP